MGLDATENIRDAKGDLPVEGAAAEMTSDGGGNAHGESAAKAAAVQSSVGNGDAHFAAPQDTEAMKLSAMYASNATAAIHRHKMQTLGAASPAKSARAKNSADDDDALEAEALPSYTDPERATVNSSVKVFAQSIVQQNGLFSNYMTK